MKVGVKEVVVVGRVTAPGQALRTIPLYVRRDFRPAGVIPQEPRRAPQEAHEGIV